MRFLISSTLFSNPDELTREYPCVQNYNFDESERDSSFVEPVYITINTLEELLRFQKEVGDKIIVSPVREWKQVNADYEIEIYDGYRE